MSSKERKKLLLLSELIDTPKAWNDILDRVNFSEATLSRYMTELKENGQVEKFIDNETDTIKYRADLDGEYSEKLREILKTKNQVISQFSDEGLFSSGVEDINFGIEEVPYDAGKFYSFHEKDKFTIDNLIEYLNFLKYYIGGNVKVDDFFLKIEGDGENYKQEL